MGEVSSVVWCGWTSKSGPIVVRFHMLTSKCASRHNGMHFLNIFQRLLRIRGVDILTLKCASRHDDVHIFQHLNFQKCSGAEMLCTFLLRNALPASSHHLLVHIVGSLTSKLPSMVMWAMGSHESFVWQFTWHQFAEKSRHSNCFGLRRI